MCPTFMPWTSTKAEGALTVCARGAADDDKDDDGPIAPTTLGPDGGIAAEEPPPPYNAGRTGAALIALVLPGW